MIKGSLKIKQNMYMGGSSPRRAGSPPKRPQDVPGGLPDDSQGSPGGPRGAEVDRRPPRGASGRVFKDVVLRDAVLRIKGAACANF